MESTFNYLANVFVDAQNTLSFKHIMLIAEGLC